MMKKIGHGLKRLEFVDKRAEKELVDSNLIKTKTDHFLLNFYPEEALMISKLDLAPFTIEKIVKHCKDFLIYELLTEKELLLVLNALKVKRDSIKSSIEKEYSLPMHCQKDKVDDVICKIIQAHSYLKEKPSINKTWKEAQFKKWNHKRNA